MEGPIEPIDDLGRCAALVHSSLPFQPILEAGRYSYVYLWIVSRHTVDI
jgi:hypothetical protein